MRHEKDNLSLKHLSGPTSYIQSHHYGLFVNTDHTFYWPLISSYD